MKILVVEDELTLLRQLSRTLEDQRYIVKTATDGESALDTIYDTPFDLIILDIMLPGRDGLSVLKELREAEIRTPVLLLSAKGEVDDRIRGLDTGADDYLPKPFSIDELFARIRSLLRRSGDQPQPLLTLGDISLDTARREVTRNGAVIDLTSREFSILEFLFYNKNRAVSRFSLAEHVWGDDFDPFSMSNFIDVHIKNLRRKLGDNGKHRIIRTLRGVGYIIRD